MSERFLSWGAGLQSTVIGEMSARGDLPKCTVIHADTGWERQATIDVREWYAKRWQGMGLDVHTVSGGNIRVQGAEEHRHIPFWTSNGGPLRRQCTRHFKIMPVRRKVRMLLGFHPFFAPHPKPEAAIQWLGITIDEWRRAKPSRVQFIENQYPLLDLRMDRVNCEEWLREHDLPIPAKSACVGCPYRSASEWLEMRSDAPEEFEEACKFDEANRHNPLAKRGGSTADKLYVWRGLEPLRKVDLEKTARREKKRNGIQIPLFSFW